MNTQDKQRFRTTIYAGQNNMVIMMLLEHRRGNRKRRKIAAIPSEIDRQIQVFLPMNL